MKQTRHLLALLTLLLACFHKTLRQCQRDTGMKMLAWLLALCNLHRTDALRRRHSERVLVDGNATTTHSRLEGSVLGSDENEPMAAICHGIGVEIWEKGGEW